jgi:cellulose synthase/poly-beta-1,6-N-acetylglucosamine synthase-like glycosyltransferase
MAWIFWLALTFVAYTYIGYPLMVGLLGRRVRRRLTEPGEVKIWPRVCVIVAAYNEQDRVVAKIQNLRALDYPADRLRIVFVSDGSTDETARRISDQPGVELIAYEPRRGKPYALNQAVAAAGDPEVLVFTDARQALSRDALRYLVARLVGEPDVAGVSGELVHVNPHTQAAAHIGLYWRYEKWIRKAESRLASTVGATGALYAIWRRDYTVLPEDTILDDVVIPLQLIRRGRRVVLEERALVYDELQGQLAGERRRKVRTITGNFQAFVRAPWLFLPWRNPVFIQFVSHKLFRLFVPYALGALLIASLAAEGGVYRGAALLQAGFYLLSLAGLVVPRWRRYRLISFVLVFVGLNWAAVMALGNFLLGHVDARWEKA